MIIQKHDMFSLKLNNAFRIDISPITKPINNIFYIRMFLIYSFGYLKSKKPLTIHKLNLFFEDGMSFEEGDINIDNKNNKVYFSESYHTYDRKPMTPEIEELLEEANFIELCKIEFLDYVVMTKDNFYHLLLVWDEILDQAPPFALLYEDDKNWFDILSFDSKEAMEEFVADHAQPEEIQK